MAKSQANDLYVRVARAEQERDRAVAALNRAREEVRGLRTVVRDLQAELARRPALETAPLSSIVGITGRERPLYLCGRCGNPTVRGDGLCLACAKREAP